MMISENRFLDFDNVKSGGILLNTRKMYTTMCMMRRYEECFANNDSMSSLVTVAVHFSEYDLRFSFSGRACSKTEFGQSLGSVFRNSGPANHIVEGSSRALQPRETMSAGFAFDGQCRHGMCSVVF